MLGKSVVFPDEMLKVSRGKVALADSLKLGQNRIIVFYFDERLCSSCVILKLSQLREAVSGQLGIEPFFLMAMPDDLSDVIAETRIDTSLTIYLDANNTFMDQNRHVPKDPRYHVLLLDGNHKILAVGNPLSKIDLKKLYEQLIVTQR